MPEIGVVQKPGLFEDLLRRLGVNRPQRPFTLDGNILPVVLVESGVSFVASPTPAYRVSDWFTLGSQLAPPINTVMADTGPLPVGSYSVQIIISFEDVMNWEFQWRDAPNAANLRSTRLRSNIVEGPGVLELSTRLLIENANERFRVLNTSAGPAGTNHQASILAKI